MVSILDHLERTGQRVTQGVATIGLGGALFAESLHWILFGHLKKQPVRFSAVVGQIMEIGIRALPIVTVLSATIGVMLAIQGIHTLRMFSAESKVVIGVALSVVREFSPLITGILVAGRSGSALAARLGTMTINQEVDALTVMAINPVRFLMAPPLLAMVIALPALTFFSDVIALFAAGLYVEMDLGLSLSAYALQTIDFLSVDDLMHGLGKSMIFAVLITLVGVINGASIRGGAEEVGKVTTQAVVQSIAAIVITDMIFAFVMTRV
ncbi:MAG: ABC transporter permease [Magnetococcales bacterium]|nr:ABC transporter permease [Magnetococcales bacterium]